MYRHSFVTGGGAQTAPRESDMVRFGFLCEVLSQVGKVYRLYAVFIWKLMAHSTHFCRCGKNHEYLRTLKVKSWLNKSAVSVGVTFCSVKRSKAVGLVEHQLKTSIHFHIPSNNPSPPIPCWNHLNEVRFRSNPCLFSLHMLVHTLYHAPSVTPPVSFKSFGSIVS